MTGPVAVRDPAPDHAILHGSIDSAAVHLCLDMQRLLAPEGPWPTPWAARSLENVIRLSEAHTARTIFARFVPPRSPGEMPGIWKRYYEKWREVTREFIDPTLLSLLPPLERFSPPALILDKMRYSAFTGTELILVLAELRCKTLVVTGAETDVCALSTIMSAVDLGYRVIVVSDAVCSSSDLCHDALLNLYQQRFSLQLEIADTSTVLESWVA